MLAAAVERSMSMLGFPPEERAFHPHVTIGRVKGGRNMHDLLRRMESITFESQPTHVTHISLVKSELRPSGSVYTTVRTFPFHSGGTATQEGRCLDDTSS
jgi:2'-5' RNA ligase